MRWSLFLFVLVSALLAAGDIYATGAGPRTAGAETLSLRAGRGTAVVALRGSILGTLRRGRLIVTIPSGSTAGKAVYGAETKRRLSQYSTVYSGFGIRYRVFSGRWKVRVRGRGIYASAAGHGWFGLVGTAGTYSVAGGASHSWPNVWRTFKLGS